MRSLGFVAQSLLVGVLAASGFAVASGVTGARAMDAAFGAVWSFLLALIVALPSLASRQRKVR